MNLIYEATITNNGGRNGEVYSPDESFLYRVVSPTSNVKNATNPEELFAAAYSACFNGALELVMSKKNISKKSLVTAHVFLNECGESNFNIEVTLEIEIEGLNRDVALELVNEAHKVCPYSKALKNNVDVKLLVV
ncbi:Ohr family peroxiredoxin [Enterococcus faecium]|uniref:Ohr family peroxiredoxin n=1 Tax=Enterococcus faecium TaxID=1352 RepID=UPI0006B25BBF|nr:Ohr family peroxiredoxin [Enterococcus faecium]